ncbi:MAG: hypothetical protein Kow0042_31510 [Calditrichia bacterium]
MKENKDDPRFCPVMNALCPQGEEKALECRMRFEIEYDPIRNIRDFTILCCAYQRSEEVDQSPPIV